MKEGEEKMKTFSFRKIGILLVMMLVAGAVLAAPVSAENEQIEIKEKEQTVNFSVNELTPWDSKAAATIEDQIDSVLMNAMIFRTYGLSEYNVQYIRTDTLQIPDDGYSSASGSLR